MSKQKLIKCRRITSVGYVTTEMKQLHKLAQKTDNKIR